jgi:hypothetical protein
MSQEHLLKLAYDAVLKGQQQKTSYRTLSESYKAVYEAEEAVPAAATNTSIQINPHELRSELWTPAQKSLYDLTSKNREKAVTEAVDVPDEFNPDIAPVGANEYVAKDKSGKPIKTLGMGPGELAVVSVITGSTDPGYCAEYLSGGNKDYDVTYPSKAKDPTYIFEVKDIELGPARIAKHGAEYTKEITSKVSEILDNIIDEFELLTPDDRAEANNQIKEGLKSLLNGDAPEPVPELYTKKGTSKKTGRSWQAGEEKPESVERREKHRQKQEQLSRWSIDTWARNIKSNTREMPWSIIFGEGEQTVIRGDSPIFVSIQTILEVIDALENGIVEEIGKEPEEKENKVERINDLIKTFKHHYRASTPEKTAALDNEISQTVKQVDKKLLKAKAEKTGESESNWKDFFHAIAKDNLHEKLTHLNSEISSQKNILSLFPSGITGLFFVNEAGYSYIPKNYLHEYISVTTISSGGPKITIKKAINSEPTPAVNEL